MVSALRNMGLQCHMVTGDNWRTARIVAAQLGIINVQAEVLPAGKADAVGNLFSAPVTDLYVRVRACRCPAFLSKCCSP